jgi:hypothetical protein
MYFLNRVYLFIFQTFYAPLSGLSFDSPDLTHEAEESNETPTNQ